MEGGDPMYVPLGEGPRHECGVFGCHGVEGAARVTYYGLFALQHRGQESAGIAISDGEHLVLKRGMGLVSEVFSPDDVKDWPGFAAAGHVRYSTTGSSLPLNAQPLLIRYHRGQLALCHNGNLTNAQRLRGELEARGSIFQGTADTEVLAHLAARDGGPPVEAVAAALSQVTGGYAFVFLTADVLMGARDPNGIRPLSIGRMPGGGWVLASETCAFDAVGADYLRDVEPGELVVVGAGGLSSRMVHPPGQPALCAFEFIYFARPDSDLSHQNVHAVRKQLGRALALEAPVEADLVTGVPDSSLSAASGFAEQAGIPYELGLVKNRYIGRTFIQPDQKTRVEGVSVKLNALRKVVSGKRVVLVDDSIVRGTTSRHIVHMLRSAGAVQVHLRITSPPYRFPCFYGIDTSSSTELIAVGRTVEEVRGIVEADSLAHLSPSGLARAVGLRPDELCLACFTGGYPADVSEASGKYALEEETD